MKRCVCERSSTFPVCDGSHASDGWNCTMESARDVPVVFLASGSLGSLADRLAHRFGGVSVKASKGPLTTNRLVVLTDGHDMTALQERVGRIDTRERVLITVDVDPTIASWAFEGWDRVPIQECAPAMLWRAAEAAVQQVPEPAVSDSEPPKVFLSHSVKDEGRIFGVIDTLRSDFGVPVFVCADSITSGTRWLDTIREQLEACERVVFIASAHSNASVFCAFEVGFATALNKPIHVICLDGGSPPLHLENLQAIDLSRLRSRKPWLEPSDALLEACLEALRA